MTSYYDGRVGYRFMPTEEELVGYFLYKKVVAGQPLPPQYDDTVHHFEKPVSNIIPWEVWEKFGGPCLFDEGLYFFSELETSSRKDSRIKRKIESAGGTWSEASSKDVNDRNGNPIGKRRYFRYENEGNKHHGDWLLDEYSLLDVASKTVLCRLRKKAKESNNSRQEFEEKPKGANKKARKDSGSVRPQIPSEISADYEEPPPQSYSSSSTTLTTNLNHGKWYNGKA